MDMKKATVAATILCLLFVGSFSGCRDISGGGWIKSAGNPEKKATFAFVFDCIPADNSPDVAVGTFTYHDHGVSPYGTYGVGKAQISFAFNATIYRPGSPDIINECDITADQGSYVGNYTPIPETLGPGGQVWVFASDGEEGGPDKNDLVHIFLEGGIYDGYRNAGYLNGGNLTWGPTVQ